MLCYIGVGSNVGDRLKNIRQAIHYLEELEKFEVRKISPVYETEPQGGPEGQFDYLNLVIEADTSFSPRDLLSQLQAIEKNVGRKYRRSRWDKREIDLDILLCGDMVIAEEDLTIPHVRMHERFFVLKPLSDLNPEFNHPVLGRNVKTLLDSLKYKGYWHRVEEYGAGKTE